MIRYGYSQSKCKSLVKGPTVRNIFNDIASAIKPLILYSDEELSTARQEYRLRHCKGDSFGTRMIKAIDNETRRRDEKKNGPVDPSRLPRREHGWYLPNDD